jgi:uncharacterized glyoxalase superfamily protein PhnB
MTAATVVYVQDVAASLVDDVDATFERALEAGARPVWQPQDKPWGRAAMFRDPDVVLVPVFQG